MSIPAPEPVVAVMDVLAACGWVPDTGNQFSEGPAVKFNFGNFELSAGRFTNQYLQPVVSFSGIYNDLRTMQDLAFDVPERVASREQVLAWVAYGLGDKIPLAIVPEWLVEGRQHRDVLPWEQHMAAYERRPQASVARDWMRVLGKQLMAAAESAAESDACRVRFDGDALRFRLPGQTLLVQAADDTPWPIDVTVKLADLRDLPKRWMRDPVHVSYFEDRLVIGNRAFAATTGVRGEDLSPAEPQSGSSSA